MIYNHKRKLVAGRIKNQFISTSFFALKFTLLFFTDNFTSNKRPFLENFTPFGYYTGDKKAFNLLSSQLVPVKPVSHTHVNMLIPSTH